jgi:hypothetical protein
MSTVGVVQLLVAGVLAFSGQSPEIPSLVAEAFPKSPCQPSNSLIDFQIGRLKLWAVGADAAATRMRAFLNLPAVDSSTVVYETDSTTCAALAQAHAAALVSIGIPYVVRSLWVVRFGSSHYVIFDVLAPGDRKSRAYVYDGSNAPKGEFVF